MHKKYIYNAEVLSVYDGDTITAKVDMGFHCSITCKFRLYGINAPELTKRTKSIGLAAKARLIELIQGKAVILETYKDADDFGRWLCDVYLPGASKAVNSMMVEEGHAVPFMAD